MSWQLATFAGLALVLVAGFAWYERTRPPARLVALVAALAALAVAGRLVLAPVPNVVATTDIALLTGYALGGAPGFAVGALAAPVSNIWLGQGPWTAWEMAGWGLAGVGGAILAVASARRLGRIGLALACAEGEEMVARAPAVDLVFGPQTYHRLGQFMAKLDAGERRLVETALPTEAKFAHLDRVLEPVAGPHTVSAFVTVQEGCDKFCTFCVVPYTRGGEFSRPVERIAKEVRRLAARGVREVTLLGQNVNAFHGEGPDGAPWPLGRLLDRLSAIEGIERLRYTTSHPRDMDDGLISVHGANPKVMPYLHLPVQSGSDRILAAMNRKHTAASYLDVVGRVRAARPDIALSSDFIVGFPGETDEDFARTLELVSAVEFAQAYSFKYSMRPGTPAAERADQVPEPVKAMRLAALQAVLEAQQRTFNAACVGRQLTLLLERPGRHAGQMIGRSQYLQAVHVTAGGAQIGDIVPVSIDSVGAHSLAAHIINPA